VAQNQLAVFYSFDNCDGTDNQNFAPDAIIDGTPPCVCGVVGEGFQLDGNNDRILLSDTLSILFEDDFTVGFYFSLDNSQGMVDLFSYRTTCDRDSSLAITYTPITNSLRVEYARDFTEIFELEGRLDLSKCWHQIVITKFNLEYALYLDGQLVDSEQADRIVPFGRNASLAIANSPCLAFTQDRLSGVIDELEILNFALSPQDISSEFLFPDRIITDDATVFEGAQVQILTGPTCTSNIEWTPKNGMDDPFAKDPTITGDVTTDYAVAFNNGACISRDTVRVNVIDPDVLQCEDLLLPNAFTPNNDGLNDLYGVSNRFLIENLIFFEVYNRSGSLIFSTSDLDIRWDGRFNGKPTAPGMYLYKIKYTCGGQEYLKIDNFSVIR
jgi:gliding motility-associated-like protein